MEFTESGSYFAAVNTNPEMIELYIKNAKSLGIEFNDDAMRETFKGSTDMGNVSAMKPSIHPIYKIKSGELTIITNSPKLQVTRTASHQPWPPLKAWL